MLSFQHAINIFKTIYEIFYILYIHPIETLIEIQYIAVLILYIVEPQFSNLLRSGSLFKKQFGGKPNHYFSIRNNVD